MRYGRWLMPSLFGISVKRESKPEAPPVTVAPEIVSAANALSEAAQHLIAAVRKQSEIERKQIREYRSHRLREDDSGGID